MNMGWGSAGMCGKWLRRKVVVMYKGDIIGYDFPTVFIYDPTEGKSVCMEPTLIETRRNPRLLEKYEIVQLKLEYNL